MKLKKFFKNFKQEAKKAFPWETNTCLRKAEQIILSSYGDSSLVFESMNSQVYHLKFSNKDTAVKVLNKEYCSANDIDRFYKEFDITSEINSSKVRKPLAKGKIGDKHSVILEWFDGVTVKENGKVENISDFLCLAKEICEGLFDIHSNGIIHKDVSCVNILLDSEQRKIKWIDFGLSSVVNSKTFDLGYPKNLEGNLFYVSPEQTGRINRVVDFRSDFYSLGIVFYYMLSGVLPFVSDDPMELVHMHLAVNAKPLHILNEKIPLPLSKLVEKLMSKNVDERYQSDKGILNDIMKMMMDFKKYNSVTDFKLGESDFYGQLRFQDKLYGREKQVELLLSTFNDIKIQRSSKFLLVSGYSGSGKTSLVNEIHKPITLSKGYFVSGKFDQFHADKPYSGIVDALNDLCSIILTKPEELMKLTKYTILDSIGEEAAVLTEIVPKLSIIIGDQPEVTKLSGYEAQSRLLHVFVKFVQALTIDQPLVIFLDDLQWMDNASLEFLKMICSNREINHLLLIGAYRENEVHEMHPLSAVLSDIEDMIGEISKIYVKDLKEDHVACFIEDSLQPCCKESSYLSELVYKKTNGNPFFVKEYLKSLVDEKILFFTHTSKSWEYNLESLKSRQISENVADLITKRFTLLSKKAQTVSIHASCIGFTFDLNMLEVIMNRDVRKYVDLMLVNGFITNHGNFDDKFSFSHDKVYQAVLSMVPEKERSLLHLKVGRSLLQEYSPYALEQNIFTILHQFDKALNFITEIAEKRKLTQLYFRAGEKTKQSASFQTADKYFKTALSLLSKVPDAWKVEYDISLRLRIAMAEIRYFNGDLVGMEENIKLALSKARSLDRRIQAYMIKISAMKMSNKLNEAISIGINVLDLLGQNIPEFPTPIEIGEEFRKTAIALKGKSDDEILSLPRLEDERAIAVMNIMSEVLSAAYRVRPELMALIANKMLQFTIEHGLMKYSIYAATAYGVCLCNMDEGTDEGYRFGQLGIKLLILLQHKDCLPMVYSCVYNIIHPWTKDVHTCLEPLLFAHRVGYDVGMVEYTAVTSNFYCILAFLGGMPLQKLEKEISTYSQKMKDSRNLMMLNLNEIFHHTVLNFMGQGNTNPNVLSGEILEHVTEENLMQTTYVLFTSMLLAYFFHDYEIAAGHAEKCQAQISAMKTMYIAPNFMFYNGLISAQMIRIKKNGNWLDKLNDSINHMKKWAVECPENFSGKYHLLEAELAYINNENDPVFHYKRAISISCQYQFCHEEALAYELYGIYNNEKNLEKEAMKAMFQANESYIRWGSKAKSIHLKEKYPHLVQPPGEISTTLSVLTESISDQKSSGKITSQEFDNHYLEKASSASLQYTNMKQYTLKLMQNILGNSGAQRCILLKFSKDDDNLYIFSERDASNGEVFSMDKKVQDFSNELPISIINYVKRTKEAAVVSDAQVDDRYSSDPYVQKQNVKSVMCIPILSYGQFVGEMYLENNLGVSMFSMELIDIIKILSGQVAASFV